MKKIYMFILTSLLVFSSMCAFKVNAYTSEELQLIEQVSQLDSEFDLADGEVMSIEKITKTEDLIQSKDLTLYLLVQRNNANQTEYDEFKFHVIALWEDAPFFRIQDAIALNWSDDFTPVSSTPRVY